MATTEETSMKPLDADEENASQSTSLVRAANNKSASDVLIASRIRRLEQRGNSLTIAIWILATLGSMAISLLAFTVHSVDVKLFTALTALVTSPDDQGAFPHPSPSSLVPSATAPDEVKAFEDRQELLEAIDTYLDLVEASGDSNEPVLTAGSPLARTYGITIGSWDVSNINDFSGLFDAHQRNDKAKLFRDDLSQWDVSSATNMSHMFQCAEMFDSDVSDWDVSNVQDMSYLFGGYLSPNYDVFCHTIFNHPLERWDVSNVVNMEGMFTQNRNFDQNIDTWNVSKVKTMKRMFRHAEEFNSELNSWDVSQVEDMRQMFMAVASRTGVRGRFNQPLSLWNTSNVQDMGGMFEFSKFNSPFDFDMSNVRKIDWMFYGTSHFNQASVSDWDTSRVESMKYTFSNAHAFDQPLNQWNVSHVRDMERMFWDANAFDQPLDNWDVSRVETTVRMFSTSNGRAGSVFTHDLSSWQLISLEDMTDMFDGNQYYNHSLCAWGKHLKSSALVSGAFHSTSCSNTTNPNLFAVPVPGPFCHVCT